VVILVHILVSFGHPVGGTEQRRIRHGLFMS